VGTRAWGALEPSRALLPPAALGARLRVCLALDRSAFAAWTRSLSRRRRRESALHSAGAPQRLRVPRGPRKAAGFLCLSSRTAMPASWRLYCVGPCPSRHGRCPPDEYCAAAAASIVQQLLCSITASIVQRVLCSNFCAMCSIYSAAFSIVQHLLCQPLSHRSRSLSQWKLALKLMIKCRMDFVVQWSFPVFPPLLLASICAPPSARASSRAFLVAETYC
jgi:hypothetical protein